MDDTLTGQTTRPVTFIDKSTGGTARKSAGTTVYVTADGRRGMFRIRIPGTLLEQVVSLGTVEPF